MVAIIRNADGTIKTFSERGEDFILQPGESLESTAETFAAYAGRLRLSIEGRAGETVALPAGTESVTVEVACPGQDSLLIDINEEELRAALVEGKGSLSFAVESGKTYLVRPHDRRQYCAAGEALLAVMIESS